ncbi:MAG TPA: HAMP domain-containing sensor histidine kinase [Anaerolineales bacterium]|nr:HAMP domain-containing sensor histidine kinase [Anaerolineales bacterium]
MFSSIRSRLWLSYLAVIVIALGIVASVLSVFLIRNPYTYRQAAVRLTAASELAARQPRSPAELAVMADALGVRILTVSPGGEVSSDTAPNQAALRPLRGDRGAGQVSTTRDLLGHTWLYTRQALANGDLQIIATPRPGLLPVLGLLRDELWRPIIQAGVAALVLALGLAYIIARWIADPLQGLVAAARSMAAEGSGQAVPIGQARDGRAPIVEPESGPREVRDLMRAFNAMLKRVSASQQAQRALVANVSHELKTPLTAIQGFSQALLDGTAATESTRRQAAETIHREAERMYRLAADLLDIARIDAGEGDFRIAAVDVGGLIATLQERFSPIAAAASVAMEWLTPGDLPQLSGDGDRVMQALANILDNAIKFAPPGTRVTFRTEVLPHELRFVVADSGPGIPKADLERIFERFYQVDASRQGGTTHGAGLGLAIAREIVEGHGGKIHVRSALGHGAEFSVHLPLRVSGRAKPAAD